MPASLILDSDGSGIVSNEVDRSGAGSAPSSRQSGEVTGGYCASCDHSNGSSSKFCSMCGGSLSSLPVEAAEEPSILLSDVELESTPPFARGSPPPAISPNTPAAKKPPLLTSPETPLAKTAPMFKGSASALRTYRPRHLQNRSSSGSSSVESGKENGKGSPLLGSANENFPQKLMEKDDLFEGHMDEQEEEDEEDILQISRRQNRSRPTKTLTAEEIDEMEDDEEEEEENLKKSAKSGTGTTPTKQVAKTPTKSAAPRRPTSIKKVTKRTKKSVENEKTSPALSGKNKEGKSEKKRKRNVEDQEEGGVEDEAHKQKKARKSVKKSVEEEVEGLENVEDIKVLKSKKSSSKSKTTPLTKVSKAATGKKRTPKVSNKESSKKRRISGTEDDGGQIGEEVMEVVEEDGQEADSGLLGVIAVSSFADKEQDLDVVDSVIKTIPGYRFASTMTKNVTHLIVGENRRTLKVLLAIAKGLWVVSFQWVVASVEEGKWLSPENYEVEKWFPGAMNARKARHKGEAPLLDGKMVFLNGKSMSVSQENLTELVEAAGGQVVNAFKDCDLCISSATASLPRVKGKKIDVVSEEWLLDSISSYSLLPVHGYALGGLIST